MSCNKTNRRERRGDCGCDCNYSRFYRLNRNVKGCDWPRNERRSGRRCDRGCGCDRGCDRGCGCGCAGF